MPTERTPLLSAAGPVTTPLRALTLQEHATSLIDRLRLLGSSAEAGSPAPLNDPDVPPEAELAVRLYAYGLITTSRSTLASSGSSRSIRGALADARARDELAEVLEGLIRTRLDGGALFGSAETDHDALARGAEDEDIALLQTMWRGWVVDEDQGGRALSAMELLLPPHLSFHDSRPFISHPLIFHVLAKTWNSGLHSSKKSPLMGYITPQTHLLHLISYTLFYLLTLYIALRPQRLISPYTEDTDGTSGIPPVAGAFEVLWIVDASAHILSLFQTSSDLSRKVLLFPTFISLVCLFASPSQAYSVLTFSIPFLTFQYLAPTSPSISLLYRPYLPLSTLLFDLLTRGRSIAGFALPLILFLVAIFSLSLNGDIFRGFFTLSISSFASGVALVTPVEEGIAPFEARLWLFITIVLLLVAALMLAIARAGPTVDHSSRGGSTRGHQNVWEETYGYQLASEATVSWMSAAKALLGDILRDPRPEIGEQETSYPETRQIPLVPPLNLLLLPLDLAEVTVTSLQVLRSTSETLRVWRYHLWSIRATISSYMMGLLCYILVLGRRPGR